MDPTANLKEQRRQARLIQQLWDGCADNGTLPPAQTLEVAQLADRLAELVIALDEWRLKGGFDPYARRPK